MTTELRSSHADSDIGVSDLYHRIEGDHGTTQRVNRNRTLFGSILTGALMAEKAKVCGPDYGQSATPAENHLTVPRFAHDPPCQCCGGAIIMTRTYVIWGMSGLNSLENLSWALAYRGLGVLDLLGFGLLHGGLLCVGLCSFSRLPRAWLGLPKYRMPRTFRLRRHPPSP